MQLVGIGSNSIAIWSRRLPAATAISDGVSSYRSRRLAEMPQQPCGLPLGAGIPGAATDGGRMGGFVCNASSLQSGGGLGLG